LGEEKIKMIGTIVHIGNGEHQGRKFGFVYCEELKRRVFFHFSKFRGLIPEINQVVEFELAPGRPGQPDKGINVRPISNLDAGAAALATPLQTEGGR
jgi:cold shock CspA family protein